MNKERLPLSLLTLYKETFISSVGCLEEIGRKLVAYSRRENKHLSLLILDIDRLRDINKKFGYEKGNEVLLTLVESIEESLRKSDIAGKYEGGSFLVILPNTDVSGALKAEERIRKTFNNKIREKDFKDENITFSVAIASFPEHGDTFDEILNNAFNCHRIFSKRVKSPWLWYSLRRLRHRKFIVSKVKYNKTGHSKVR